MTAYTLDEMIAEFNERSRRHAARPWPLRHGIDAYRWLRRTARDTWRTPPWRYVEWFIQRGLRGWSGRDVWNFDTHLSEVIAGGLTRLRDHGHTYPDDMTAEEWDDYLTSIIEALELDIEREVPGETLNESIVRIDQEYKAKQQALHKLAERFGHMWD